jgi:hypothetical protein
LLRRSTNLRGPVRSAKIFLFPLLTPTEEEAVTTK